MFRKWGTRLDTLSVVRIRRPCVPQSYLPAASSPLTSRRLVGSPEKRRAVRSTAAVRGGQGCGSIRALKSRIRATPRFGWRPRDRRGLSLRGERPFRAARRLSRVISDRIKTRPEAVRTAAAMSRDQRSGKPRG